MGVPSEEGGSDRWSADHLFLDQDAIPTIVEVKRGTDTRARREVVAQMLDYAANGVMHWPLERLRSTFEANCEARGRDPEEILLESFGLELDLEEFWQRAVTNLQAGKVRLIFVADNIPAELRRIVEFLNEQMNPAEVLAVEMKQHVAEGREEKAFVPRLIGHTAHAQRIKATSAGQRGRWDEVAFFQDLEARRGTNEAQVAGKLFEWAKTKGLRIWWGKGSKDGSFFPMLDYQGEAHWTISVGTYGRLEVQFQQMQMKPPFDDESKRMELRRRLNEITGVDLPADKITKRPSISLSTLKEEAALKQCLEALNWFVEEVKAREPRTS